MLDRLVIGTANWGRDYNGHNVCEKEQNLIMEYMKEVGIEWLDVATAYGTEDVGKNEFHRIVKADYRIGEIVIGDFVISHSLETYNPAFHAGYSTDKTMIPTGAWFIELPYSVMNRLHEERIERTCSSIEFIARSIFCKGKALKYFSPRECIDFVLMNPRIDKVILGIDSVDQLKENVAHLVKMEKFTHNEEVDTRKF